MSLYTNIWAGSVWSGGIWNGGVWQNDIGWTPTDIPQIEATALYNFWKATDGHNWTNKWDLPAATTAASLAGVTVSGGRVTGLNLQANGTTLSGPGAPYLVALTALQQLRLFATNVSGDISGYSALTDLTILTVRETQVSGDVSGFSALTNLTNLQLYHTNVTGNISGYSALVELINLLIHTTQLTGDFGFIKSLPNLSGTGAYNSRLTNINAYTSQGPLPNWPTPVTISIRDNKLTQTHVNSFLQDLDAGGSTGGTLNITGSGATANSAPSWGTEAAPSDTALAVVSLLEKNWTLTVAGSVPQWVQDLV